MATPVPSMAAVDNGDGTATTYYDDGSTERWLISPPHTLVRSTPPDPTLAQAIQMSAAAGGPVIGQPQPYTQNPPTLPAVTPPPDPTAYLRNGWTPGSPLPTPPSGDPYGSLHYLTKYAGQYGGYTPGSSTYLNYRLDQPNLFDPTTGFNLQTGSGGPGDPFTGSERQSPMDWVQGAPLFQGTGKGSLPETMAPAVNFFLRSDTPSGLGTPNAPPEAYSYLQQALQQGYIRPTQRGLQFLQQVGGQPAAGALQTAQSVGVAGGAGGTGTAGGAAGGAAGGTANPNDPYAQLLAQQAAANSAAQAAQLAYQNALLKHYSDQDALAAAEFAYKKEYEAKLFEVEQAGVTGMYQGQPTWSRQVQEAGLTGTYNGQPTFAAQQAKNEMAMNLLNQNAQLSGPSNYLTYLRTLSNTPAGLTDIVNSLAGQFNLSNLQSSAPGSTYERQSLNTMVRDLNQAQGQPAADASGVNLPGGSQWNARNFGILSKNPTQLGLLQNLYGESGRDYNTEYSNFLSSLPRYGGPQTARVGV